MIASLRGVIALAVVALVLAIVAVATTRDDHEPVDRAVLHVDTPPARLAWTRPHGPDVTVERAGDRWTMVKPSGACDDRAVEAVLATLRGARWHRRGARALAGSIHTTLAFPGHVIELGDPIHGADQAWIVVDGAAMLVDGWVARALDPELLALRDRNPLAGAPAAKQLAITRPNLATTELRGRPWRDARGVLAPELVGALLVALERVELVRIPGEPIVGSSDGKTTFAMVDARVAIGGPCPGEPHLIALQSIGGSGCIDPARWHDVEVALDRLDGPATDVLERRPAAGAIARIQLVGGTLELDKRPAVITAGTTRAADPDRIAELVRALASPATLVPVPALAGRGEIHVELRDGGAIDLIDYGALLARRGEGVALQLEPAARAVIDRSITTYLDPTRWLEDATTIASLEIDGLAVTRGTVLGEWARRSGALAPLAPVDAALVEALANAIANVRAPVADVPASWRPIHTITVSFAPPVGAPSTHVAELGPPTQAGCLARLDHVPGLAPLALCTAAQSLLLHR